MWSGLDHPVGNAGKVNRFGGGPGVYFFRRRQSIFRDAQEAIDPPQAVYQDYPTGYDQRVIGGGKPEIIGAAEAEGMVLPAMAPVGDPLGLGESGAGSSQEKQQ